MTFCILITSLIYILQADVTVWIFGTSSRVSPHLEAATQKACIFHRTPGTADKFLIIH